MCSCWFFLCFKDRAEVLGGGRSQQEVEPHHSSEVNSDVSLWSKMWKPDTGQRGDKDRWGPFCCWTLTCSGSLCKCQVKSSSLGQLKLFQCFLLALYTQSLTFPVFYQLAMEMFPRWNYNSPGFWLKQRKVLANLSHLLYFLPVFH